MKRLLFLGFAVAFLLVNTNNCLADGYVSANLAAVIGHDSDWSEPGITAEVSTDTGYGIALALGNDLRDYRIDLEAAYRINDLDEISTSGFPALPLEGEIASTALLANLYLDIHNSSAVAPYFGFGAGIANVDVDIDNILGVPVGANEDDTVFAYQFAIGTSFNIADNYIIDLNYRYFATEDLDLDGTEIEYATSNISLGFRANF